MKCESANNSISDVGLFPLWIFKAQNKTFYVFPSQPNSQKNNNRNSKYFFSFNSKIIFAVSRNKTERIVRKENPKTSYPPTYLT